MAPLDATGRVLWYTPSSAAVAAAAAVSRSGAKGNIPNESLPSSSNNVSSLVAQTPAGNTSSSPSSFLSPAGKTATPEALLVASSLLPCSSLSSPTASAFISTSPSTSNSSSSRNHSTTTARNARAIQQQGQITSAAAGSNGNTATTANTISTRGGASHDATSTDTRLAQNDALSIYGPSFRNILCANPRGRSLKKIVEMKAIQLQKRQARRALGQAQCQHRDPEYSLHISARKETCNNISERTASVMPNDQLVTPWHTRFLRGASNNIDELNGSQTLDGDVDDDDDDEDLDADWVKGMLAQMEGECYYADMPFELLHLVFGNFLRVSMDNLKQLAERKKAKAIAIKAAERELEDRWAKTPLLPGMAASTPGLSQKRHSTCTCNVCRRHQHSSQPPSPSSTNSEQQQYAPSTLPSRRHTSPNTMHEQMPTNGHQVLVNQLASSPPSSGYASASSADVPQYPTHSDESDLYLGDGGDSRSEFESEAYSGEDDEDSEDHESLGHLRRQDDLESVDDIVASLSISNGYQSGYSSDDLDALSVESTDAMEQIDSDYESRVVQPSSDRSDHSLAISTGYSIDGHSSSDSRTRSSSSSSSSTSSALAGYTNIGRNNYHRRFRYHHHHHHTYSTPYAPRMDPSAPIYQRHCNCDAYTTRSGCASLHQWTRGPQTFRKSGINRIGDDQDEESTLQELHRDQYFHPLTHVALHSDLYVCSLVNRQWRLAALQLMWQSVVLDSESCRLELPDTVDCTCHLSPRSPTAYGRRPASPSTFTTYSTGSHKVNSSPPMNTTSPSRSRHRAEYSPLLFSSPLATISSSLSASSSSSSTTSPPRTPRCIINPPQTRIEAMLDSYLDLYGLDLAKNVQTVELDLQLLSSWSLSNGGNAIHIKRILQRLAPFNHLRLVCSERPSSSEEDFVTNFRFVMEAHYGHIRHLHLSPGFAISRAWAQEMDRMHALEKLTIESLNSMERVDYDWSRIRVLVLHAIVPSSLFGIPRPIPISLTPPTPPPTPYNGHENGGSANSSVQSLMPVLANTSMTSHDVTNGGSLSNNGTAAASQALPLGTNIQASPHSLPATDSTTIVNNTLQNTSTVVVGTPHGTFFHLNGSSPTTSLLTFMPSSYTHPNLTQYLLHHPVAKLVRQPRPGWWLWNSLRRLEVTIKNVVLPREWLQELVMVLSHRAQAENDLIRMHEQEANVFRRPKSQQESASLNISSSGSVPSKFESYQEHMLEERLHNTYGLGPRLEVIHLDCEVSHPHKEIFMDLMNQWGHQLREFHFSQSAELTDEFFWCCLQRGKNLRRLSLGDSKGITGEGVELGDYQYHSTHDLSSSVRNVDGESKQPRRITPNKTNSLESAIPATLKQEDDRDHHHHSQATTGSIFPTPKEETKPEMKRVVQRVTIGWPRDFEELRLDQSRVRSECLIALKQHCPGMRYKVRDIRWSKGQRKPDLSN
ncbi:hypothetical protein BGW42_004594 [Actinomortierella wolfii]|nr:hypothetical protein BGW42_004594 [Actinomortierella wolfii]